MVESLIRRLRKLALVVACILRTCGLLLRVLVRVLFYLVMLCAIAYAVYQKGFEVVTLEDVMKVLKP